MKTKQKLLSVLMAAAMAVSLLNGCSGTNGGNGQTDTQKAEDTQQTKGQTAQKDTAAANTDKAKIFYYASRFTANNVSPHQSGSTAANEVIRYIESKLYRWVVKEDGVTDEMVAKSEAKRS